MRVRAPLRGFVLFVGLVLAWPAAAGQSARAQDNAESMIARIESAQSPNRQGLDALTLRQVMDRFHVPGVNIAVIKDFSIHWAKGYGVADVETGRLVQIDSLFQAASISKPVQAMAALRLVQEGRFSLDDDVNSLLKLWHVPKRDHTRERPVTPRSLFSHTSGADDGFGFPTTPQQPGRPSFKYSMGRSRRTSVP